MTTRRSFLLSATTAAAATVAGSSATAFAANETLNIGVIGTGGRARHLMKSLAQIDGVRITHLCDIWDAALSQAAPLADPRATATKVYAELLAEKDVDAVLIGTSDHQHVPITIAALRAGKDVYVEKPLTHDLAEGAGILQAQEQAKKVVQVGTQQRSMPHIREARELVQSGKLGTVLRVKMSWNRNTNRVKRFPLGVNPKQVDWKAFLGTAPDQPFDEYRFRNWRWFWDFGGGIFTDLMVHWVDVAHFVLGVDTPLRAVSLGEFVQAKDVWETPDTVQTILSYPNALQMHFEGTFSNARHGARIEFLGTEATLYADRGRLELIPERKSKRTGFQKILGHKPDYPGADFYDLPDGERLHLQNWVDCVRSRKEPTAPLAAGVASAAAAHLANRALRAGQTATAGRK
ncbi:MAG: Gfo/Idh/MocA family oxidoreductase [Bacteroidales bacterium]|nr:Gfo/Idh/MocA family oxidoreductase [Bacteroidales bacterium]